MKHPNHTPTHQKKKREKEGGKINPKQAHQANLNKLDYDFLYLSLSGDLSVMDWCCG